MTGPYTGRLHWPKNLLGFSLSLFTSIMQCLKAFKSTKTLKINQKYGDKTGIFFDYLILDLVDIVVDSHYDFKNVERMRDAGKVISVSVSFVQVNVQTDPRWAKTNSNIPSPGKARSVKRPTPGPTITIKSPPHALPPPPPPALN